MKERIDHQDADIILFNIKIEFTMFLMLTIMYFFIII
jgi:hypothetical protein